MEAGALRAPAAINRISVTAPLLRLRSDDQLVALFRAGNDAAFSVIHDRYRQRLFAYSRQMLGGSRQDAEDALQDVFLRAYSSLRSNNRPVSLRAWLYKVAHNRCIDHLRKPVPPAVDLFDTSRKPLHDPIAEYERRDDLRRLIEDVRRLPEQQRSALLMREMDGLTYAELADALGVSLPAVKSLLVRARIGLVEAVQARDTACTDIRHDLADAFDRGVRASGRARRHLRDCDGCVEYRAQLRAVRDGLHSLSPGPGPLTAALKLLGIGGAGSAGAASAGGGAAAGGGVIAVAGGGTVTKVAAVVCCAALTAGGAVEVQRIVKPARNSPSVQRPASTPSGAAGSAAATRRLVAPGIIPIASRAPEMGAAGRAALQAAVTAAPAVTQGRGLDSRAAPAGPTSSAHEVDTLTGGAAAPDETTGFGDGVDGLTPRGSSATAPTATAPDATLGAASQPPAEVAAGGGLAAPVEPADAATISAPAQQPEGAAPAAP